MKYIVLLLISFSLNAQNLITNSSFENGTIPTGAGQIDSCTGWFSIAGSPDYFNTSATIISGCNIPYTFPGNIQPYEGFACVGFCYYAKNLINVKEYLYQKLKQPLITGQNYSFSMMVLTEKTPCIYGGTISDQFSVGFSTVKLHKKNKIVHCQPVYTYPGQLFAPYWKKLTFTFTADSDYKYLIIGSFVDDSLQTHTDITTALLYQSSYIYIDNVELHNMAVTGINELAAESKESYYFDLLGRPNNKGLIISHDTKTYTK